MTLKTLIETSKLQQEDKNLWFSVLESLDDAQIKIFENFINGEEEKLLELTENIKAKKAAFENLDEKTLDKIINSEQ